MRGLVDYECLPRILPHQKIKPTWSSYLWYRLGQARCQAKAQHPLPSSHCSLAIAWVHITQQSLPSCHWAAAITQQSLPACHWTAAITQQALPGSHHTAAINQCCYRPLQAEGLCPLLLSSSYSCWSLVTQYETTATHATAALLQEELTVESPFLTQEFFKAIGPPWGPGPVFPGNSWQSGLTRTFAGGFPGLGGMISLGGRESDFSHWAETEAEWCLTTWAVVQGASL